MNAGEQRDGGQNRQPVRLALPQVVLRHRERAGIYCQPTVSVEFQKQSKRYVVRGVESDGGTGKSDTTSRFVARLASPWHGFSRYTT